MMTRERKGGGGGGSQKLWYAACEMRRVYGPELAAWPPLDFSCPYLLLILANVLAGWAHASPRPPAPQVPTLAPSPPARLIASPAVRGKGESWGGEAEVGERKKRGDGGKEGEEEGKRGKREGGINDSKEKRRGRGGRGRGARRDEEREEGRQGERRVEEGRKGECVCVEGEGGGLRRMGGRGRGGSQR